jgi:hypothetical protein
MQVAVVVELLGLIEQEHQVELEHLAAAMVLVVPVA